MLRYILLFLCLFTFSTTVTATEYKYDYQEYNNLETAFYGVSGEANIQYQVLYYLLPLDEEVLSISLNNPLYISQHKHIDIFTGYASITDGQIMPINQDPSPLFPKTKLISYQTYFKQGIHILIIKIPYQKYNYSEQQLDILQHATIVINTTKKEKDSDKSKYLTKITDFETLTEGLIVEERIKAYYYSLYSNPFQSERNALGIESAEMIIISPTTLVSDWQNYADYKSSIGLNTEVVDIADITSIYDGRDNAEKLRNFLIDIYTEWSSNETPLRFILLGGDHNLVPSRLLRIRAAYNGSWHNNNVYSDLYFAGLDGDWDNDNDNLFGEGDNNQDSEATGMNGDEADLYAEVAVGRIPVETTDELENWINKQQDYASVLVSDQFYEKVLLLGEYLGSSIYGGSSMNEIANDLSDYSIQTLYAQNGSFSEANLTTAINNSVSQVHHLGHGSTSAVFSISNSDLSNNFMNQDYPLIYTQGCHTANLSTNDSIGESFIIHQRGAYAYIGNTSYGFYSSFENQGPSQLFHRKFVEGYVDERLNELGRVHHDGKEDLVGITGQTGTRRYVYFDNILFADPSTELIKDLESVAVEQVSNTSIKLSFSNSMGNEVFTGSNYNVYQRDAVDISYPVISITQQAEDYFLHFTEDLPAGIPLRITIENIPNLLNPTVKLIKSLYTIKESSIIAPTIWRTDESPIYVYKHMIINSILTIEPGTEIRINSNKSFYIYWGGEIKVDGDSLNYVNFTSYSDDPTVSDKWTDFTFMMEASPNSCFSYAMIENSQHGIWLDSLSTITLDHVRFHDNHNSAIYAKHSTVNANYLELTGMTNRESGAMRIIGGVHNFNHITSAENAGYELVVTDSAVVNITNSIIWGVSNFDSGTIGMDYSNLPEDTSGTNNLTTNPQFMSATNLSLQAISPAINSGITSELDPDSTITDRGYWYYHCPNSFNCGIVPNSSPKLVVFNNLSLGEYDSIQWDFDNDGVWDSYDLSPEYLYLGEGLFDVKMRLIKGSFQQDIVFTDLINQTFSRIQTSFPVSISLDNIQLELDWDSIPTSDLYEVTGGTVLGTEFNSLSIQEETIFRTDLLDNRVNFFQILPLEQNIHIAD